MGERADDTPERPRGDAPRADDADAVVSPEPEPEPESQEHGNGPRRYPRTGETPAERVTRLISELLQETRVAAVGVQVIIGFLLAIPFNADLQGLQRDAYVVALLASMLATGLLLAPTVLHRALLHHGQAVWLVTVGTRLVLAGMLATAVALIAVSLLVGDRIFDGTLRFVPSAWTAIVLLALWGALPGCRRWRLDREHDDRSAR